MAPPQPRQGRAKAGQGRARAGQGKSFDALHHSTRPLRTYCELFALRSAAWAASSSFSFSLASHLQLQAERTGAREQKALRSCSNSWHCARSWRSRGGCLHSGLIDLYEQKSKFKRECHGMQLQFMQLRQVERVHEKLKDWQGSLSKEINI